MWRTLETELRTILTGHEGGNPGYKPRTILRATAPASDPTVDHVAGGYWMGVSLDRLGRRH